MSKNTSELSGRKGLKYNLFDQMGRLVQEPGDAPEKKDLKRLADEFLLGEAVTYGAATFYDFLKPENQGKKAYVCNGSACLLAGTQDPLRKELEQHLDPSEIGEMCCLGRCHENGAFHYAGHNYSARSSEQIAAIIQDPQEQKDPYRVGAIGEQVLTLPFPGRDAFYQSWKDMLQGDRDTYLDELKASGLRGRGGAGFPMAFKLEMCRKEPATPRFIVCNADEGDPGAYTDRYLLEQRPHAVLFGMMAAAYMMDARWGVLYIRAEYPESIIACKQALADIREAGLIGKNILGSGFDFDFKLIKAQGAYICGEETALLSSIEGQRPEVRIRPPYPTQEGLFNRPTVVNNVETLACLHYILDKGGEHFASLGRGKSTGTKLMSLDGHFNQPGMYEVEMGTPLRSVIDDLGGGFRVPVKAMHIGGPLGGLVPVSNIDDLTVDFESFAEGGFLLGHASVICIPEDFPMVQYLEHLFEFTAHESCGKCFPCRLGSVRGQEMLSKAQHEGYRIDRLLFDDLVDTMEEASLCALGGGLPLPVKNALQYFEEELKAYFA